MNNNKITGVVNGTDPNDAINKSQLDIFETKLNYFAYTRFLKHTNQSYVNFPSINEWYMKSPIPFELVSNDNTLFRINLNGWYHIIYTDNIINGGNFTIQNQFNGAYVYENKLPKTNYYIPMTINAIVKFINIGSSTDHVDMRLRVKKINIRSSDPDPKLKGSGFSTFFIKYLGSN